MSKLCKKRKKKKRTFPSLPLSSNRHDLKISLSASPSLPFVDSPDMDAVVSSFRLISGGLSFI